MSGQTENGIPNSIIFMIMAVVVFMLLGWAYGNHRAEVNAVFFQIAKYQMWIFAVVGFENAQGAIDVIDKANPGDHQFAAVQKIFGVVGYYWRWVFALLMGLFAWRMTTIGIGTGYTRRLRMEEVLEENAVAFPQLTPIVGRNLLDEDPNEGNWRAVLQPLQFSVRRRILLNADTNEFVKHEEVMDKNHFPIKYSLYLDPNGPSLKLDTEKTKKMYVDELGEKFSKPVFNDDETLNMDAIKDLPDYYLGLIAVFVARGQGKLGQEEAEHLIIQMATSFREEGRIIEKKGIIFSSKETLKFSIDVSGALHLIEKYSNRRELFFETKNHSKYIKTWVVSLYRYSNLKGITPTAWLIWLRPTDKPLWYALNQVGGDTPWPEAAGVWAHMQAEDVFKDSLTTPMVDSAVKALGSELVELGWLKNDAKPGEKKGAANE